MTSSPLPSTEHALSRMMDVVAASNGASLPPQSVAVELGAEFVPARALLLSHDGANAEYVCECIRCNFGLITGSVKLSKSLHLAEPLILPGFCDECDLQLEEELNRVPPISARGQPMKAPGRPPEVIALVPPPKVTPQCSQCSRYMAQAPDGQVFRVCGTCRQEKAANGKTGPHECEQCGTDMQTEGYDRSKRFCTDCAMERTKAASRRQEKKRAVPESHDHKVMPANNVCNQ